MAPTHLFESASNIIIAGGSFVGGQSNAGAADVKPSVNLKPDASTMLVYNSVSWNAILNSGGRADPVRCYPGTREAVIGQIETWISHPDPTEQPIFWLSGPAGSGKSAIAQSIAERCLALRVPMANFFFFRSDRTRNHAAPLVTTLLVQLFDFCPAIKWRIHDFITQNPYILNRSIEQQLKTLLGSELTYYGLDWRGRQKTVLILDGLDECSSESTQQSIIRALHYIVTQPDCPFILFVSSRAEPHLIRSFNTSRSQVTRLHLDGDNFSSSDDIRRFVVGEFNEIKETHHLASTLNADWPTTEDIESIVRKSSGHFIYAATIMRFLQTSPASPILNLEIVKGIRPVESSSPFAQLDAIYSHILARARNWPKTRDILAAQVLPDVVDIGTFSTSWTGTKPRNSYILDALGYSMIEVSSYASDLTSLVEVRSWAVKFYHTSLSDFLLDKGRSGKFFVDLDSFRLKVVLALFRCASGRTEHSSWSLVVQHFDKLRTTNDVMTEVLSSPPLPSGELAFNGTMLCTFLVKIEELYLETDLVLYKSILKKWLTWFHTHHGALRDDQLDEIQHANDIWKELAVSVRLGTEWQEEDNASAHTDARDADKCRDGLSNSDRFTGPQDPHINPHGECLRDSPHSILQFPHPQSPHQPDNSDNNSAPPHLLPPLRPISPLYWSSSVVVNQASDQAPATKPFGEEFEPDETQKVALKLGVDKQAEATFAEARKTLNVKMPEVLDHADRDIGDIIEDGHKRTMASLQVAANEQYKTVPEMQAKRDHRRQLSLSTMKAMPSRAPEAMIEEKDRNLNSRRDDERQGEMNFVGESSGSSSGPTNGLHEEVHLGSGMCVPTASGDCTPETDSSSVRPQGPDKSVQEREEVHDVSHQQRARQPTGEPPSSDPSARPHARMECRPISASPDDLVPLTQLCTQARKRGSTASIRSIGCGANIRTTTEITPEGVDKFPDDDQGWKDCQSHGTSPRTTGGNAEQHHKKQAAVGRAEELGTVGEAHVKAEEEAWERAEESKQKEDEEAPAKMNHGLAETQNLFEAKETYDEVQKLTEDAEEQQEASQSEAEGAKQKEEVTRQETGATGKEDAHNCEAEKMGEFTQLAQFRSVLSSAERHEIHAAIRDVKVKERERLVDIREANVDIRKTRVKERERLVEAHEAEVKERQRLVDIREAEIKERKRLVDIRKIEVKERERLVEVREAEVKERKRLVKIREADLKEREKLIKTREAEFKERENLLRTREAEVEERERLVKTREADVKERAPPLALREVEVKKRKEAVQKPATKAQESETEQNTRAGKRDKPAQRLTRKAREPAGPAHTEQKQEGGGVWSSSTKRLPLSSNTRASSIIPRRSKLLSMAPHPSAPSARPPISEEERARKQAELVRKQQEEWFRQEQERKEAAPCMRRAGTPLTQEEMSKLFEHHERLWKRASEASELTWNDFPWPMAKMPRGPDDITYALIEAYMHSPHWPDNEKSKKMKDRIKGQMIKWQPDRVDPSRVHEEWKEQVKQGAGLVVRYLSDMLRKEKDLEGKLPSKKADTPIPIVSLPSGSKPRQ